MQEPSVLDYLKSLLTPWKGPRLRIPQSEEYSKHTSGPISDLQNPLQPVLAENIAVQTALEPEISAGAIASRISLPTRSIFAFLLAFAAQWAFTPPQRNSTAGVILLLAALGLGAWAYLRGEWRPAPYPVQSTLSDPLTFRKIDLIIGSLFAIATFITSGGNRFTWISVALLVASIGFMVRAFWLEKPKPEYNWFQQFRLNLANPAWRLSISRWALLLLAITALVLFFRFHRLGQVPPEMVSDHAEKYLDIGDVLSGYTHIFFPRNGGREALQFYLVAALIRCLNFGFNFFTLKFSTSLIGLLSLPFLYLLGKEMGSKRIGLLAFAFAGIAYWTNIVSRAGMRLPFYFLFTAATLYFLLRGLRTANRNDFILAGLSLGLGFYGYSANRILALVVLATVGLFLLHNQSKGYRQQVIRQTGILILLAFVVFMPLLRYIAEDPNGYGYRMFSRMGAMDQIIPGLPLGIFFDNLWRALKMFSVSAGVVWVVSIPDYPALEVISGGLFYLGVVLALLRYLRERHWLDLFWLVSIPFLMLPSILSLAFPNENPNLYRTGGAMVPVFLLAALALDGFMSTLETHLPRPWGARFAWAMALILFAASAWINYDLVFNKYFQQYRLSAWNTSEMGRVIHDFSQTVGSPDSAWVMGYPHWADTRLVAINAGYPFINYALFADQLESTLANKNAKLFIVNPADKVSIDTLDRFYPQGWFQEYVSDVPTKNFLLFFVPQQ